MEIAPAYNSILESITFELTVGQGDDLLAANGQENKRRATEGIPIIGNRIHI
jgi:hypothetical protein